MEAIFQDYHVFGLFSQIWSGKVPLFPDYLVDGQVLALFLATKVQSRIIFSEISTVVVDQVI